jgi:hypothetical protein
MQMSMKMEEKERRDGRPTGVVEVAPHRSARGGSPGHGGSGRDANSGANTGWRTRRVFERYAIVSRTDIADAMPKLQTSKAQLEIGHAIGHAEQTTTRQHPNAARQLDF